MTIHSQPPGSCGPKSKPRARFSRGLKALALMAASLILGSAAQAQSTPDEYIPDVSYNNGVMTYNRFANRFDDQHRGRKAVALPNGDVIIAGKVPPYPHQNNGEDHGGIGLALRNANGQPKDWPNPDPAHSGGFGSHMVIPGNRGYVIDDVKDVAVHGNTIYVLVDSTDLDADRHKSVLYVIGTDGRYKRRIGINHATRRPNLFQRSVSAIGIATWNASLTHTGLAFVGEVHNNSNQRYFRYTYYQIDKSTGEVSHSESKTSLEMFPTRCPGTQQCTVGGIALGGRDSNGPIVPVNTPPKVYITGGQRADDNAPWQVFTARIDAISGEGKDFIYMRTGSRCQVTRPGGLPGLGPCPIAEGIGNAIAVEPKNGTASNDKVFAITREPLRCRDGVRVMSHDGSSLPLFDKGSVVIGGDNGGTGNIAFCVVTLNRHFRGLALDYREGRLAVAGRTVQQPCADANCEQIVNGALAVLNRNLGVVAPLESYEYLGPQNGTLVRTDHSGFRSVVGLSGNRYLLGGSMRHPANHPDTANKRRFTSLIVKSDTLFSDGFE